MSTVTRTIDVSLLRAGNTNSPLAVQIDIPESLQILDNPADKAAKGFGVFRILTPKDGDKRVVWDSRSFAEILDAKNLFDKLVAEGLVPYKVGLDGKQTSDVMTEFDPHAEEVIFMPIAMVAGG